MSEIQLIIWIAAAILALFVIYRVGVRFINLSLDVNYKEASKKIYNVNRKEVLKDHILIKIPDGLQDHEKSIESIKIDVLKKIQSIKPVQVLRSNNRNFTFSPIKYKQQREPLSDLLIDDLKLVLISNKDQLFNLYNNSLEFSCSYPSKFSDPCKAVETNERLENINYEIDQAIFTIIKDTDNHKIVEEINNLYVHEIDDVRSYNDKRESLLSLIQDINEKIDNANTKIDGLWSDCINEVDRINLEEKEKFIDYSNKYQLECQKEKDLIENILHDYKEGKNPGVENYFNLVISSITWPSTLPYFWELKFDANEAILISEIRLPDIVNLPPKKVVTQKNGTVIKLLNKEEKNTIVPSFHPAILLRVAYEIFRNDVDKKIKLLVINGWVEFHDPQTGILTKAYTSSMAVKHEEVIDLVLEKLDPIAAFNKLKGVSAGKASEIIPIRPVLTLNTKGSRFVEAVPVLDVVDTQTNLAVMDWQLFEHLIRELFEKKFSKNGAEVKITRASKDKGVDAVVFDPDPITGGKYIIQAKRYTNTVDVSSVRDLCAVVQKEGASRGILVTTSNFGADSYAFIKDMPITLLNGSELLGLLNEYGYKFRIDIEEAKKLLRTSD